MAEIKIKGDISGSTTIKAPDSGSDEIIELSTVLDGKAPLDSPTFTGTPALPDGTTLAGAALTSGKILQVVRATDSTARSTTSTSFVDANISVTITPQKSDSAILLIYKNSTRIRSVGQSEPGGRVVITDSSNNAISGTEESRFGFSTSSFTFSGTHDHYYLITLLGYDTPATTSAKTYKVRYRSFVAAATVHLENATTTGQMYAIEVSA